MDIGVFFGSFNPVHLGHTGIAEAFLDAADLDELWLSVSPQNPWKEARGLAAMEHRVTMTTIATVHNEKIKVLDFEKELPQPSYTYEALLELSRRYPQHQFKLLIGGDNYHQFHLWRNYDKILDRFEVLAYPREYSEDKSDFDGTIKVLDAPLLDFASTNVREALKSGEEITGLDPLVLDYIKRYKVYD